MNSSSLSSQLSPSMAWTNPSPDADLRPAPRRAFPGTVNGALVALGGYLVLAGIGLVQLIGLTSSVSRRLQGTLTLLIGAQAVIIAVFVLGAVLVAKRITAVPLLVFAAVGEALTIYGARNHFFASLNLLTMGLLLAIVVLLSTTTTREYFAAHKRYRRGW